MAIGLQAIPFGRIPSVWSAEWYAEHIRQVLALADTRNIIPGPGIQVTGQPDEPATLTATQDLLQLLEQNYVLATTSGFLTNERVLEGQPLIIKITDNGPNSTIVVGLFNNSIGPAQFRQSTATSVVGRPQNNSGNVNDIVSGGDGEILRQAGGVLAFGLIEAISISDFDEAAQDAVGSILVDTATIDLTYTDATPEIKADLTAPVIASLALADTATQSADLSAAISALNLNSGVYTPTLTNVLNLAASTAYQCQFLRVGSVVTVSGKVDIDPTASGSVQLGISLPIASNIGTAEDCGGTAAAPGVAGQCAAILGDATNDRAQLELIAVDLTNKAMAFSFTYRVIP